MVSSQRVRRAQAVADYVARQRAVGWSELKRIFGSSAPETAAAKGLVRRVLHGIYGRTGTELDVHVRAAALTLWTSPVGAVTGLAAAFLWRIVDDAPDRVSVQVPASWSRRAPSWARLVRVGAPERRYTMGRISLVSAADAAVQVWREERQDVGVSTAIATVMRHKATPSELLDAVARRKQLPRRAQLLELIGLVPGAVTSYLEYVAWRNVFPPSLFPDLEWQVEKWANGRRRVMDAYDREAAIDLEFDGGSAHGGVDGFERDRERDRDLRSVDIEPLHFTYRDVIMRPGWCRQQYVALRAKRLRERGSVVA